MSKAEFLLELLCEEIPANALPGVRDQLGPASRRSCTRRASPVPRLPRIRPFGASSSMLPTCPRLSPTARKRSPDPP